MHGSPDLRKQALWIEDDQVVKVLIRLDTPLWPDAPSGGDHTCGRQAITFHHDALLEEALFQQGRLVVGQQDDLHI